MTKRKHYKVTLELRVEAETIKQAMLQFMGILRRETYSLSLYKHIHVKLINK